VWEACRIACEGHDGERMHVVAVDSSAWKEASLHWITGGKKIKRLYIYAVTKAMLLELKHLKNRIENSRHLLLFFIAQLRRLGCMDLLEFLTSFIPLEQTSLPG
jgi:hypothetical protein